MYSLITNEIKKYCPRKQSIALKARQKYNSKKEVNEVNVVFSCVVCTCNKSRLKALDSTTGDSKGQQ